MTLTFHRFQVPMAEVQNVLCTLGEKLEQDEAANLFKLLGITADEVKVLLNKHSLTS